jgi:hypothetical protein
MNPSRPNNNPEGEAKCYSLTLQSKGSFLFGFVDSHGRHDLDGTTGESAGDGVPNLSNPRRCAWVSGRIWRGRLGFRPKPMLDISLWPDTKRSGRNTTYSDRFSLPLSFFVAGRCAWVTDLSSSLLLYLWPAYEPFRPY